VRKPPLAAPERKFINCAEFHDVCLIVLSYGFFEPAIILIFSQPRICVIGIGIGQELREDITPLKSKARRKAPLRFHDESLIIRMAAFISALIRRLNRQILWEWA